MSNMNFFVVIPLVLLFNFYIAIENSLSRQNSPQPHVLFVAIEIQLLLVVNSGCYAVTGLSLLRQTFLP